MMSHRHQVTAVIHSSPSDGGPNRESFEEWFQRYNENPHHQATPVIHGRLVAPVISTPARVSLSETPPTTPVDLMRVLRPPASLHSEVAQSYPRKVVSSPQGDPTFSLTKEFIQHAIQFAKQEPQLAIIAVLFSAKLAPMAAGYVKPRLRALLCSILRKVVDIFATATAKFTRLAAVQFVMQLRYRDSSPPFSLEVPDLGVLQSAPP